MIATQQFSVVKRALIAQYAAEIRGTGANLVESPTIRDHRGKRNGGGSMRQSKSERQARIVAELRAAPSLRVHEIAYRLARTGTPAALAVTVRLEEG